MRKHIFVWPLLLAAGCGVSGCVAAAIPALAGAGMLGTEVVGKDDDKAATVPSPPLAQAPAPAPLPPAPAPQPAPTPAPALPPAPEPAAPMPPPTSQNASPVEASETTGFARMVRFARAVASASKADGSPATSALLADPFALDGRRRVCDAGAQPVAVIDLDPAGGILAPPAAPARSDGMALGLAVLREAGVVIAWLSDLPIEEAGALRTSLEAASLDPRGEDIIALKREADDRKQLRRENLGKTACIIAIGGDERSDFDERFRYLRNPEAGAALEPVIGDGWFLIKPVFAPTGPDTP